MKSLYQILLTSVFSFFIQNLVWSQTSLISTQSTSDIDSRCGNNNPCGGGKCGCGTQSPQSNNSFDAYTGNEFREIKDLEIWGGVGDMPLVWMRYSNSRQFRLTPRSPYGTAHNWSSSFMYNMMDSGINRSGQKAVLIFFPDGERNTFFQSTSDTSIWLPHAGVSKRLFQNRDTFVLQTADGYRYHFEKLTDNSGNRFYQLQYFLDPYQNKYTLSYTNDHRLTRVTEPAGRYLQITYGLFNKKIVITQVSGSDGRSVLYHYKVLTDSLRTWVALDTVSYGDGTKAAYEYSQSEAGARPNLSHAIDPRVAGAFTNAAFTYISNINGFIHEEKNGATGEVMATLDAGPEYNVICYANGSSVIYDLPTSQRGNLHNKTNGLGEKTKYQYFNNGIGFLKNVTDALGRTTTYDSVTVYGNPIQITYPDGSTEKWTRDDLDLILTHTDELGRVTTYTRDSKHRVKRIDHPDGTYETFTYNSFGQVMNHRLKNKGVEKNEYNYRGLKTSFTDALGHITKFTYDVTDRLAAVIDANGNTTRNAYNDRGLITKTTNADNSFQTYQYDAFGNRTKTTDELGHSTSIKYDEFKRPVTVTDALARKTSYSFDLPNGVCGCQYTENKPAKIILPSGKTTAITYDLEWKLLSQTEGAGTADAATTFYEYDVAGRLVSTIDPNGKEWTMTYDKRDRKKTATDPLGHTTQLDYDFVGNITKVTRPDGSFTINQYDAMNRDTMTIDPKGQIVKMRYDAEGNLAALIDPKNNIYAFRYDLLNRKTRMTYPDGLYEGYAYDSVGNLKTYRAKARQVRTYQYDSRNREIYSFWTSPYKNDTTPAIIRTYDAAGRLLTMTSSVSALTFTYNNANELLSETQNVTGGPGAKTVSYTYTKDGLRKTMTYPNGTILNYTYTSRNQMDGISAAKADLVKYTYDLNGNRISKMLENGTTTNYTYDAANRTLSVDNLNGTASFARFDYGYDKVDRRTFVKRDNKGDVYGYDATDQITKVLYDVSNPESSNPGNPLRTMNYEWDSAGNRINVVDNSTTTNYSTNNMNQYTDVGSSSPTYYKNDNLNTFNGWTYTYDAQNRLLKAQKGSATVSFAYDPLNRCVQRTINGVTTFFYYDGWNLIEERTAANVELAYYVHGAYLDEPLKKASSSNNIYYHSDALGSVVRLTDNGGNVVEQYSYDVFGTPTVKNAAGTVISISHHSNRFLFTGREYISQIGLYDYRNRMYSASLGRFLQIDPIRFDAGDYNLYRYVGNNSVNRSDPFGLFLMSLTNEIKTGITIATVHLTLKYKFSPCEAEVDKEATKITGINVTGKVWDVNFGLGFAVTATASADLIQGSCPSGCKTCMITVHMDLYAVYLIGTFFKGSSTFKFNSPCMKQ